MVHDLVDIPVSAYVSPSTAITRSLHTKKFRQILSFHRLLQIYLLPQDSTLVVLVWLLFNVPVNNLSFMFGRSYCFLDFYQYFGELKVSCSRTLHGGRGVQTLNLLLRSPVPLWNSLPAVLAEAPSLVAFKEVLSTLSF